jgi:hypothetical protein
MPKRRKIQRYCGFGKVAQMPGYGGEIGGGRFVVNATAAFTRSLGGGLILPLPTPLDSATVRARIRPAGWATYPLF